MYPMPEPPYSEGKTIPSRPSLPNSLMTASGNSLASSHFMTLGAISRSANSRTIFFSCSCSSESWKSKARLHVRLCSAFLNASPRTGETSGYNTTGRRKECARPDYTVGMAAATTVPMEVYLRSPYEPDAEYVDGVIEEGPMRE